MISRIVTDKKPWYRIPMVWMIIAIPFAAICSSAVIMWYAETTKDSLVVDDYYKQGLVINMTLDRDRHAAQKKLSASIKVFPSKKLIMLEFNKGLLSQYPSTLQLKLLHATRANSDVQMTLLHGQANQYIGYLKHSLPPGYWYIELGNKDWRIGAKSQLLDKLVIELQPILPDKSGAY